TKLRELGSVWGRAVRCVSICCQAPMGKTKRQPSMPLVSTIAPSTKSRNPGGTIPRPLSSTLYWLSPNLIWLLGCAALSTPAPYVALWALFSRTATTLPQPPTIPHTDTPARPALWHLSHRRPPRRGRLAGRGLCAGVRGAAARPERAGGPGRGAHLQMRKAAFR